MKSKNLFPRGFTLVELLIVIALIAILSVAVLATINPIEQSNKAKDSTTQNDAAEVMNAYERYYTNSASNKASYPWLDVDTPDAGATIDTVYGGISNTVGFGLCGGAAGAGTGTSCSSYSTSGLLINNDELKNSFLNKGYTYLAGDPGYKQMNLLYVIKQDATKHNSIYVCYIPKAKANRSSNAGLRKITFDATGLPTAIDDTLPSDFVNGTPDPGVYKFTSPADSLFKCVP